MCILWLKIKIKRFPLISLILSQTNTHPAMRNILCLLLLLPLSAAHTPKPNTFADPLDSAMMEIVGGTYKMGHGAGGEAERVHEVEISTFYLSQYEVTTGQYLAFCEATNSHWPVWLEKGSAYHIGTGSNSLYKDRGVSRSNPDHPVIGVSWADAVAYCNWLQEKTGKWYRLPTEAEWEYAARGGQSSKSYTYAGSNKLAEVGWYDKNAGNVLHAVGGLKPNDLGLYDMSGNVWEWCADWYDGKYYSSSPRKDPKGPARGTDRVLRGGSWYLTDYYCRPDIRSYFNPTIRQFSIGFRVARDK
jgi:formylglycine-generating enzyme required for sulfatase activity